MMNQLELNEADRRRLAQAFQNVKRVDYAVDCVLEGSMGRAYSDDSEYPTAFCLACGSFRYYAGDPNGPGGQALIGGLRARNTLMPSTEGWIEAALSRYGDRLSRFPRYSFSTERLSQAYLSQLLDQSPYCHAVVPLTTERMAWMMADPANYLEIEEFTSPEDFLKRGFGFAAMEGEQVMGIACSSLVCSRGIEVSVYVKECYRERGVGTAVAGRLVLESIKRGRRPNWDAANLKSVALAKRLGFTYTEAYDVYYWVP